MSFHVYQSVQWKGFIDVVKEFQIPLKKTNTLKTSKRSILSLLLST